MQKESVVLELKLPKTTSLNKLYSSSHWTVRKKEKDAYTKIIQKELDSYDHYTAESMSIDVRYNNRYDVDNFVVVPKFVADALVAGGWIPDDSPKYYKQLRIRYDESVEKNFCQVRVSFT